MRPGSRKPLIRYRFKDNRGYVYFLNFRTDKEARLWFEKNKEGYGIREFGSMGLTYKLRLIDCLSD